MSDSPRIALITGGNRGIGRATALQLAQDGLDVVLTYNSHADEAAAVVAEVEALGRRAAAHQLDVGDTTAFAAFADVFRATLAGWGRERFDALILNAGMSRGGRLATVTEQDLDDLYAVHVKGVLFLTQRLEPLLADGGRVITLSTGLTRMTFPERLAYGSMKGAVEVMTRYLAAELGPRGITVNTVAPGAVATDFSGGMLRDTPAFQEQVASHTALARVAHAEDIAPAIAALVGEGGRWVTAQRIEASGGMGL
jgi:NAD(P)-dependent dehydrogenase (short-subunit alcohol dehydrogenase family)